MGVDGGYEDTPTLLRVSRDHTLIMPQTLGRARWSSSFSLFSTESSEDLRLASLKLELQRLLERPGQRSLAITI